MSDLTPETRAEWREHLRTGGLLPRADQLALLDALEKAERERPASEPPNETARCPGCAHTCCPYPSLECDGDSDRVRTCGSEVRYSMQASCRRTDTRNEDCTPMIVGLAEEWEAVESPNPVIVQTYRLAAEELRERLAGQPTEDEVLDSIAACTNPVTRLPKWLQAPALGRDFRPIHAMVVEAIRERYHLVPKGPS